MIRVTLFHGPVGWAIGALSIVGACWILYNIEEWLGDRVVFELPFRLHRRGCRPGSWVELPDGRPGRVMYLLRDLDDFPGPVAAVEPYDEDQQALPAEMIPASELRPLEYEESMA